MLERLRLPFSVVASDVDEFALPDEAPAPLARRLALAKAQAVAAQHPDCVVIGSDQVADLDGEALGKPGNHARAIAQLQRMRGQTVVFQTAVAVVCQASGFAQTELAQVKVQFRDLTDDQIERYLRAETPYDCAGSAKSEGLGIALLDAHRQRRPHRAGGLAADPHLPLLEPPGSRCYDHGTARRHAQGPAVSGARTARLRLRHHSADLRHACPWAPSTVAAGLAHWVCENAKSARAYLKRVNEITPLCQPIQASRWWNCRAKSTKKATTRQL